MQIKEFKERLKQIAHVVEYSQHVSEALIRGPHAEDINQFTSAKAAKSLGEAALAHADWKKEHDASMGVMRVSHEVIVFTPSEFFKLLKELKAE